MNKPAKLILGVIAFALSSFFIINPSSAAQWEARDSVYVPSNQIIDGSLYASGRDINIDGVINGDLIVAAQNVTVTGEVAGDIIAIAQSAQIKGKIGGSLRIMANNLAIESDVARNVTAMANNILVGQETKIGWDAFLRGGQVDVKGDITGRLQANGGSLSLSGSVGKSSNLRVDSHERPGSINIASQARIGGDLVYCCQQDITIADQASITGNVREEPLPVSKEAWPTQLLSWLISLSGMIMVGLAIIALDQKKRLTKERLPRAALGRHFLTGLLILITMPITAILLGISIIGLPLAIASLGVWLALIVASQAIAGIIIGRFAINYINRKSGDKPWLCLIVGLVIIKLLLLIPYASVAIGTIAIALGIGNLVAAIRKYNY